MNEYLFTVDGKDVKLDESYSEGINAKEFERGFNVVPGKHYTIEDKFGKDMCDYIYLGSGWSLCVCLGSMYISPSHYPHWNTIPTSNISEETIQMAIALVRERFGLDDGYEIDA